MATILDQVVDNSGNGNGGAKVKSEQHDTGQINFGGESAILGAIRAASGMAGWDAAEMGISQAEAERRIQEADTPEKRQEVMADLIQRAINRANLATTAGRVNVFSAMETPWHGLGVVLDRQATSQEALAAAGLADWDLQKLQTYVDFGDQRIETGSYAIIRGDNGTILTKGVAVGDRYEIVSNEALFEFGDAVIEQGAYWETAGALGDGERVWMLAAMPNESELITEGDEVRHYALFISSHDGSSAIRCFPTTERVVCQNTYNSALGKAGSAGISMRHTTNIKTNINQAKEALGLVAKDQQEFVKVAKGLTKKKLVNPESYFHLCLDHIVDVTVADRQLTKASLDAKKGSPGSILDAILSLDTIEKRAKAEAKVERAKERRGKLLEDILNRYETDRNNGLESISGSRWAGVNAVTEHLNHSSQNQYRTTADDPAGKVRQIRESRFNSTFSGRIANLSTQAIEIANSL